MDHYIGKMLDNRYEILECIGTGGMAMVYKARDHRLNRLVAVKILKPELANDADFRRRFHDESQAVAMLSNANIVSVYDVSHSDGLDYIVMELIDGMTLKQYMQKRGTPLNWREALHFITQIMRALSHAHSRGIIHRDIKPHNIMVLRDGSVKVTDFGIAQLASATQNTLTQEAIGSVHYISPEQARGSHVDCRTDIYSAGVVLYEMLTGRLPFEGDTPVGVAIQHINAIPVPPRSLNPDVPKALEDITMKAMAPSLDQRYRSADDMLEDLKEFRKNPDMEVPQPDLVDEPTMIVRPVRSGMSGDTGRRPRIQPEPEYHDRRGRDYDDDDYEDDYDDSPRQGGAGPTIAAIAVVLIFIGGMLFFLYNFVIKGMLGDKKAEISVPSLLGYTLEELENNEDLLEGFKIKEGDVVFSEKYEEGQICEQTPEAGSMVSEDEMVITVNISGGTDKMYMENVANMEAREALNLLQNEMGLDVEVEEEYNDTVTKDYVIRFSPMEGMLVEKGDKVTIVVSLGPETAMKTMPNVVGSKFTDIQRQLPGLGLTLGSVDYQNSEYAEGLIIWQSVTGEVEQGTAVSFWVSKGPAETEPPATETPTAEPTETPAPPTQEPTPSPTPLPTENIGAVTSTQTITVDLSGYERPVDVRIVVGDTTVFDGTVDTDSKSVPVTASGVQTVRIYVNGEQVESYSQPF